jgi:hypothetical protein
MPETNKPSIGGKDKDESAIAITPKIAGEVMQLLLTGDPAAIASLKIDGAEELEDRVNRGIYQARENALPWLVRTTNKVTDTTLGRALLVSCLGLATGVSIYVVQKGVRGTLKERKEEKSDDVRDLLED